MQAIVRGRRISKSLPDGEKELKVAGALNNGCTKWF
jgi:hypothetical protein